MTAEELLASIEHLPVKEQFLKVKEWVREDYDRVNDPSLRKWVVKYSPEIMALFDVRGNHDR
jgi:hypothetical protein